MTIAILTGVGVSMLILFIISFVVAFLVYYIILVFAIFDKDFGYILDGCKNRLDIILYCIPFFYVFKMFSKKVL